MRDPRVEGLLPVAGGVEHVGDHGGVESAGQVIEVVVAQVSSESYKGTALHTNYPESLAQRGPDHGSLCVSRKEAPSIMYLSRHRAATGPRWALDGRYLPQDLTLDRLLEVPAADVRSLLEGQSLEEDAEDPTLPPVEPAHEVWASGVTYLQSREARELESTEADAYERVYDAERPELFFKALGWRVVGPGDTVHVREDSRWNVPEPELVLVVNSGMEIVGYTAGNDVSSRDIEGENTLYLPQAKVYDGSCSLGPGIVLSDPDAMRDLPDDRHGDSTRRGFHARAKGPGRDLGRRSRAGERGGLGPLIELARIG